MPWLDHSRPFSPEDIHALMTMNECLARSTDQDGHSSIDEPAEQLHRHLSLLDLLGIGVGGTVGSGIFVLTGQIASQYAGRATWCSFALSGMAAMCSGLCFAELSGRIPATGSTYAYAKLCWGRLAAVVAAACLTLEYAMSGAAVARTWGDKVILMASLDSNEYPSDKPSAYHWLQPMGLNVPAFLISASSTFILLAGIRESKLVTNVFASLKMSLVTFMILGGFWLWFRKDPSTNLQVVPWAPLGAPGIFRGATSSFFGYLGYDEVCCVAAEARNPARNMPRAVLGTLGIVTTTYILASLVLANMVDDPTQLSATSGFPSAFQLRRVEWAASIAAWGEILTLPLVVLVSLLAQPRILYGMAQDGLISALFLQMDGTGNLQIGTLVSGTFMTLVATGVPFTYLDDLISTGILIAFCLTDSCLILMRQESPDHSPALLKRVLMLYNGLCCAMALSWTHGKSTVSLVMLSTISVVACSCFLVCYFPRTKQFGGKLLSHAVQAGMTIPHVCAREQDYFRTPFVPALPCFGIAINWYLIAQLDLRGLLLLVAYLGATIVWYYIGCFHRSHSQVLAQGQYRAFYSTLGIDDDKDPVRDSVEPSSIGCIALSDLHQSERGTSETMISDITPEVP